MLCYGLFWMGVLGFGVGLFGGFFGVGGGVLVILVLILVFGFV